MKALLFFLLALPLVLSGQSLEKARRLAADGNHREAADLLTPLVLSPQTDVKTTADALRNLSTSLGVLDAETEFRETADAAAKLHSQDPRVLLAASLNQERIRQMQLLTAALPSSAKAPPAERVEVLWSLYEALTEHSEMDPEDFPHLTDMSSVTTGDPFSFYGDGTYPRDASGKPIFFVIPESWEAAQNDGERIRWLLDQFARLAPGNEAVAGALWAKLIHPSLRILTDFKAPADHDCLALFRAFLRASNEDRFLPQSLKLDELQDHAQGSIQSELMDRNQRPALVTEIREWLKTASKEDAKWMREDIEMLTGAYGRFLGHPPQIAGQKATLEFIWRNSTEVSLTARRIDVAGILAESEKRLSVTAKSEFPDPEKITKDSLIHMRSIGTRLLLSGAEKFLSKPVAEWRMDLQPAADHEESTVKVATPLSEAGAYWIEATLPGDHKARCVLWIESIALVAMQMRQGMHYFLADAITGAPTGVRDLAARNPFGVAKQDVDDPSVYWLASAGNFDSSSDSAAGIERVDAAAFTSTLLVPESLLDGSVVETSVAGRCGAAIVAGATANVNPTRAVLFDAINGGSVRELLPKTPGFDYYGIGITGEKGKHILWIGDRRSVGGRYALHRFALADDCTPTPLADVFIAQKPVALR